MASGDIFELRTRKASLLMRVMTWLISKQPRPFPAGAEELRKAIASREPPEDAPMPDAFENRFKTERWEAAEQPCVTLHPKGGKGAKHIIYFHGGGFIKPMFKEHWPLVAALIETTGASVTVPLYNVVPEASYRDAEAQADAVFAKISGDWAPSEIALAGDSAGGNLALALALRLHLAGGPQAGKLVLFAPWLDVTLADEASRAVEADDIMLRVDALRVMGEMWAGERDPANAGVSPLYADDATLAALPPTAIFQGRHDIFVVDCRNYAESAKAAGNPVRLYEYAAAPHVFMALTFTSEAKDCLLLADEFLKA